MWVILTKYYNNLIYIKGQNFTHHQQIQPSMNIQINESVGSSVNRDNSYTSTWRVEQTEQAEQNVNSNADRAGRLEQMEQVQYSRLR